MAGHKTIYIDYSRCIGCETCEAVCRFTHGLPRVNMTRAKDGVMMPLYCRHCETPYCVRACPRGALLKGREGEVLLEPALCEGCETKNCLLACPYGGIFMTMMTEAMVKCDLCLSRRAVGLGPACVEMCPCGAMFYADPDEIAELHTDFAQAAEKRVLAHIRPKVK
ncbi:MAG: 4Fe-4S dicluster domain-containing protein [Desulfovibrio sp.]|nr:MAG: 4Fe-4S dicluster domain-containing protein [Desulfovibrio sp.]